MGLGEESVKQILKAILTTTRQAMLLTVLKLAFSTNVNAILEWKATAANGKIQH